MERAIETRYIALLAALLGATAIFTLDLLTPAEFAAWTLYVLPLLALLGWGKKRDVYFTTVVCAGLLVLAFLLTPAEQTLAWAAANRALQLGILFVFAFHIGRRIDSRRELLRQHSRLKRLLDERTVALEQLIPQLRRSDQADSASLAAAPSELQAAQHI
jgi:hypothetical protein